MKENENSKKQVVSLSDDELGHVAAGTLEDSLKKLQEGMKIDGDNNNDGYQIDERIREMIRQGVDPYQKG